MSVDSYTRCPVCRHPKDTLREDYEFYWDNSHVVIVSYGCTCENCQFTHSFKYESNINKIGDNDE